MWRESGVRRKESSRESEDFSDSLGIARFKFENGEPSGSGMTEDLAIADGEVEEQKLCLLASDGSSIEVIGAARVGLIETAKSAEIGIERASVSDDSGDLFESPEVEAGGEERNETDIGEGESGAETGAIATADIDHGVVVFGSEAKAFGADSGAA